MHKKEIYAQLWADIDFVANLLTVTTSKSGRSGRQVPLTRRFREVLEGLPGESDFVFTCWRKNGKGQFEICGSDQDRHEEELV
jgi:hypothetical protein